jgi:dTMP kinase
MKLISFEGIDASGKETQAKMLYKYLKEKGYNVAFESFPRYDKSIGNLIGKTLRGEVTLTPEALHMLYEVDRIDFMERIEQLEECGYDFLILDRFTHSNIAFGVANNLSYNWLNILQDYVRKPDITFLLDITVEESVKRRKNRGDDFEKNLEFLNKARMAYTLMAKNDPTIIPMWVKESTPEQLHEVILTHLQGKEFIK